MALCWRTHLSQRGEVRGPDRRKITQEQTSLNLRGAMKGWREGGEGEIKKKKRCRNVEGEMEGESEKHGGRDNGAKYLEEWGELRIVETEGGGLESQSELNVE